MGFPYEFPIVLKEEQIKISKIRIRLKDTVIYVHKR